MYAAQPDRLHDLTIGLMSTWPSTGASSVIATDTTCAKLDGPQTEARLVILCEKNAVGRYLVAKCKYSSKHSGVLDMAAACLALLLSLFSGWFGLLPSFIANRSLLALTADDETPLVCD